MRIDGPPSADGDARGVMTLSHTLTWDMPTGLPFLGAEPPACSEPSARADFETAGTAHDARRAFRACKRTCMSCPYLLPCREWAITEREPWGVWGATTPRERRAAWNKRQKNRQGNGQSDV